jgi:hypothetical protein
MLILAIPFGLMTRSLAIEKGKNVGKWTIVGFIPIVGIFAFYHIVGATNERLERKIDALLNAQGQKPDSF